MKRVGMVGCGSIARVHAKALGEIAGVELVGFADLLEDRAREFAESYGGMGAGSYGSLEEMIEGGALDVLHICTPHYLHVPMAIMAMEYGVDVWMEKPPAIGREEYRRLTETAAVTGKRVGVCFQNRYNESVLRMQRMVEEEEMGAPIGARAFVTWDRREAYYRESGWRGSWETEGGGVLMNQAIHTLDLLVLFLGKAVKAEAGMANHHLKGCIAVEDTMEAYMEFEQARACFYATNSYVKDAPILLEVAYEKAVFRLEGDGLRVFYADNRQYESNSQVISEGGKAYWGNSHKRCIEDFYSCLEKQIPCKNDLAKTENTFCLVMDLYESAKCNSRG